MESYGNLGGNSGITGYEDGADFIRIEFKGGSRYLYNYDIPGAEDVEKMKELAKAGIGLNSFVSRHVKKRFARKER